MGKCVDPYEGKNSIQKQGGQGIAPYSKYQVYQVPVWHIPNQTAFIYHTTDTQLTERGSQYGSMEDVTLCQGLQYKL